MRAQQEILDRIEIVKSDDWMGTIRGDLSDFLDYENAKQFLKDDITEEQWAECKKENSVESIKKEMSDYLDFAFEKAEGQRGISAGRSMDHYSAWIWLLGEEDHFGDVTDYHSYGIPNLNKIKEFLNL